ncbi:heparinase II/III domain-containing protein [Allomesorhizobium camelthorni]|uniref:heparinase II/III domain-containing protein n=1 Tax=Allomesorhizobium camelthorni TaxID=475069 RepID=UPI003CCCB5A9
MAEIFQRAEPGPRVACCLQGLGDILPLFAPAPASADRPFWTGLPEIMRSRLIADAEAELRSPWPVLTAQGYRAFTLTGDRVGYERDYFARRRRLNTLALAEAVEGRARFVDALIDGIYLVCEESGWQLPAHNAQEREQARDPLPDSARPVIDLFAAETGAQLAVIASILGDVLDAVSPAIVARIDQEVETRITRPYLDRHFWWMGNGDEPMINWTPWCTQNVLLSTFTRPTDQAVRRAVITKAAHSLDAFLKGYGEDGACDEGAFYYRHAALCLFGALTVMDTVAPNVFSNLWRAPKIRNMAEFVLHAHVLGPYYINFADASAVLEPCGAREFLFGKAVGSQALCAFAAADAARNERPELPEEINLYYRLLAISTAGEMSAFEPSPVEKPDIYYPSCGLFVARDVRFVVAAKAGDNGDGHNHNDVGSVTVYKDGLPLLIDVGVETYTAKTFSPQRYEIWTMQSAFHNLPSFEGVGQQVGEAFAARDVEVALGDAVSSISMDIAGAYPEGALLSHYRRTLRLTKGGAVEIVDRYAGARQAELSLMLCEKPVLSDGRIDVGDRGEILLAGAGLPRVEEIEIADPGLRLAWPERIYRVLVPIARRELRLRIA